MNSLRRVVIATATGLAIILAVLVPAAASGHSSPAPSVPSVQRPAHLPSAHPLTSVTAAASGSGLSARAAAGPRITCVLKVDYPHNSTHNPFSINVVANWTCTAHVAQLTMTVKLYTGGLIHLQLAKGGPFRNNGKAKLRGNASFPCLSSGFYFGRASGTVIFPRGYTPHKVNLNVQSADRPVLC